MLSVRHCPGGVEQGRRGPPSVGAELSVLIHRNVVLRDFGFPFRLFFFFLDELKDKNKKNQKIQSRAACWLDNMYVVSGGSHPTLRMQGYPLLPLWSSSGTTPHLTPAQTQMHQIDRGAVSHAAYALIHNLLACVHVTGGLGGRCSGKRTAGDAACFSPSFQQGEPVKAI